jgi:hypothetical protein
MLAISLRESNKTGMMKKKLRDGENRRSTIALMFGKTKPKTPCQPLPETRR